MMLKKQIKAVFSAAAMLVLVLDSRTALIGASSGIELCMKTIIPPLFPFLFLCSILTDSIWGTSSRILRFLGRKTGVPLGGESILIAAVLGGYPAGAQTVAIAYENGKLTFQDAQHLLTFCSNAGPAFLFGILSQQFDNIETVLALYIIHILSAMFTGAVCNHTDYTPTQLDAAQTSISDILIRSMKATAAICGWIILFCILSEYLSHWFYHYFSRNIQIMMSGFLELSSGCCRLYQIQNASLRFLICSCMLSFGGICIALQTTSVIGTLSIKPYLFGKILQTIYSAGFSILYLHFGNTALVILIVIFSIIPKKTVDFQCKHLYNKENNMEGKHVHAVS